MSIDPTKPVRQPDLTDTQVIGARYHLLDAADEALLAYCLTDRKQCRQERMIEAVRAACVELGLVVLEAEQEEAAA